MVGRVRLIETRQEDDQSDAVGNDAATTPLEAKYYVDRTGVGCLAVLVSRINSGGSSKYNFTRLSKISPTVDIPLGVHIALVTPMNRCDAISVLPQPRSIQCGAA